MGSAVDILIIDDSPEDGYVFQEALGEACPDVSMRWLGSGEEAIAFLRHGQEVLNTCPVKLVVLDMNMPGLNGVQTLRQIRGSSGVSCVPVAILSTSRAKSDVERAYHFGANVFLKKPISFQGYLEQVQILVQHWLRLAELPYAPSQAAQPEPPIGSLKKKLAPFPG
jgi:CheY-like chemotaxis protein